MTETPEIPEVCTCQTIATSGWDTVQVAIDPGCPVHGTPVRPKWGDLFGIDPTYDEDRIEEPTFTASEVKERLATATAVALALGRKEGREEAGEEIAVALEAIPGTVYPEDIFPPDGTSIDAQSARVMRFAYPAAARIARDVVSQDPEDAPEPRTAPTGHSDLPPTPEGREIDDEDRADLAEVLGAEMVGRLLAPPFECSCYKLLRAADGVLRHHPECPNRFHFDLPEGSNQ